MKKRKVNEKKKVRTFNDKNEMVKSIVAESAKKGTNPCPLEIF